VTPVTAFVESAQSEKLAEDGRETVIQAKNPVLGTEEGSGNPQIELAEYSVFPLGEAAEGTRGQIVSDRRMIAEDKADAKAPDIQGVFLTAGLPQAVHEGGEHFPVWETDAGLQSEAGGFGKASHEEGGKPPVTPGIADAFVPAIAQKEGAFQHFLLFRAGEPCAFVILFGNNGIGVVYADFCSGIDTVLSLPEFDQPGSAPVVKIDGETVKNHLKAWSHIIVEPGISGLFLRGVQCGGKEPAVTVKIVAEGIYQFVQEGTFGAAVHRIDFTDDPSSAALKENAAEEGHEK